MLLLLLEGRGRFMQPRVLEPFFKTICPFQIGQALFNVMMGLLWLLDHFLDCWTLFRSEGAVQVMWVHVWTKGLILSSAGITCFCHYFCCCSHSVHGIDTNPLMFNCSRNCSEKICTVACRTHMVTYGYNTHTFIF